MSDKVLIHSRFPKAMLVRIGQRFDLDGCGRKAAGGLLRSQRRCGGPGGEGRLAVRRGWSRRGPPARVGDPLARVTSPIRGVVATAENVVIVIGTLVDEHLDPDPNAVSLAVAEMDDFLRDGRAARAALHRVSRDDRSGRNNDRESFRQVDRRRGALPRTDRRGARP